MIRQLYEVNRKYLEFDPLDQLKNEPSQPMAFHLIVWKHLFIYLFSFIALKYIVYTYIWLLKNANLI